jgi:hypothetical protein
MLAALAQSAAADPINAKNSLTFPATCDDGQTIQVVVNGNGAWTPAHVVGSTAVFIPQPFDLTFELSRGQSNGVMPFFCSYSSGAWAGPRRSLGMSDW